MAIKARSVALSVMVASALAPRSAEACGGSGPGGTGGCDLEQHGAKPPSQRITASFVATDTTLLFGGGRRAGMHRALAFASLATPLSSRLSFQGSLGGFIAGHLETAQRRTTLGPGAATSLGLSLRMVDGRGASPLVIGNLAGSATSARADRSDQHFEAYDLRATGLVGKTIAEVVTPYALGRLFGGPAFWRWDNGARVQGTDLYKFQVGGGVSAKVGPLDLFVEAAPLGERTVAVGGTLAL